MLRLTKKADYGLMALKYLAEQRDGSAHSAKDIAEAYHIPPQLLAKILQTLAKARAAGFACRDERRICAFAAVRRRFRRSR